LCARDESDARPAGRELSHQRDSKARGPARDGDAKSVKISILLHRILHERRDVYKFK
jgi:hypothetical protein